MKTKYTKQQILCARQYWKYLSWAELYGFWKHYTVGTGRSIYSSIGPDTSFADYLVKSADESWQDKHYDL
jgi:hypothetical protein